MQFEKEIKR